MDFAKGLKMKVVENKLKLDLRNSLMGMMIKKRMEREEKERGDSPDVSPKKRETDAIVNKNYAFNKTLDEETKQMSNIANEILRKKEYHLKFKQPMYYADSSNIDPRLTFFSVC